MSSFQSFLTSYSVVLPEGLPVEQITQPLCSVTLDDPLTTCLRAELVHELWGERDTETHLNNTIQVHVPLRHPHPHTHTHTPTPTPTHTLTHIGELFDGSFHIFHTSVNNIDPIG